VLKRLYPWMCFAFVLLAMGIFSMAQGRPAEAQDQPELQYYRRRLERNPKEMRIHIEYQDVMLKMGRRSQALREYLLRMTSAPQNGLFIYLYARLLDAHTDEALVYLKRAVKQSPNLFAARFDLARAYYYRGKYDEAILHYRAALRLKPGQAPVHHLLGLAYYHKGYIPHAIAEYRQAIELDENDISFYLNLGIAYYYTGKFDAAIAVYQKALGLDGGHSDWHTIYRDLGMAYAKKGEAARAEGAYRKALELKPDYIEVYENLGNLAFNRGDYGGAAEAYEKTLAGASEDGVLHFKLGLAYYNDEAYKAGIPHLQRAVEIDPTRTGVFYYLGQACYKEGMADGAKKALKTYVAQEKRMSKHAYVLEAKQVLHELNRIKLPSLF